MDSPDMNLKSIIYKKENEVATITLNRPKVLNALNQQMVDELEATLGDAENDDDVKAVVIRGAGKCFCAGHDLREKEIGFGTADPFEQIETMHKPVIAAVHGYAITGGFLLAACCDIIIATEDARFSDSHARWGIIPSGTTTQRLSRKAGLMHARYFMLTSDFITAREAEKMGLVARVTAAGKLDDTIKEITGSLLKNSSRAMAHIKTMMNRGFEVDLATAVRMEVMEAKWGRSNEGILEERESRLNAFREKKTRATD